MKADQRRKEIASYMMSAQNAVPGGKLSEKFGVSRQIIVQDISALKELLQKGDHLLFLFGFVGYFGDGRKPSEEGLRL